MTQQKLLSTRKIKRLLFLSQVILERLALPLVQVGTQNEGKKFLLSIDFHMEIIKLNFLCNLFKFKRLMLVKKLCQIKVKVGEFLQKQLLLQETLVIMLLPNKIQIKHYLSWPNLKNQKSIHVLFQQWQ